MAASARALRRLSRPADARRFKPSQFNAVVSRKTLCLTNFLASRWLTRQSDAFQHVICRAISLIPYTGKEQQLELPVDGFVPVRSALSLDNVQCYDLGHNILPVSPPGYPTITLRRRLWFNTVNRLLTTVALMLFGQKILEYGCGNAVQILGKSGD